METDADAIDLSGATICALIGDPERDAILARLGPDPLRGDPSDAFLERCARTATPIAAVLMDQSALGGVGNVYRCEALFACGVDPFAPARTLGSAMHRRVWDVCAAFLATLLFPIISSLLHTVIAPSPLDMNKPFHSPTSSRS